MTDAVVAEAAQPGGRNVVVATAVGVCLGILVVATVYTVEASFVVLVAIAVAAAVAELSNALDSRDIHVPTATVVGGTIITVAAAYLGGAEALVMTYALVMVGACVVRLAGDRAGYVRDVMASALVVTYVPLLAGFAMLILAADDGPDRVVTFVLAVVMSDTGGFLVGSRLGRHRLSPVVSPKKSWEGLGGSLVASMLVAGVAFEYLLDASAWKGIVFGAAIVVAATIGDLGESLIKRDLGLKDMGSVLPGHGGVMDRLDSMLPAAPLAMLLFVVLLR